MLLIVFTSVILFLVHGILPITDVKRKHKETGLPVYSSNNHEDIIPLEKQYLKVLGLENDTAISNTTIIDAYNRLLQEGLDSGMIGQLVFVDINELTAAKDYLLNTWAYYQCKN